MTDQSFTVRAGGKETTIGYENFYEAVRVMGERVHLPREETEDMAQELSILAFQRGYLLWEAVWAALRAAVKRHRRYQARFRTLDPQSQNGSEFVVEHLGFRDVEAQDEREELARKAWEMAEKTKVHKSGVSLLEMGAMWLEVGDDSPVEALVRLRTAMRGETKREVRELVNKVKYRIRRELRRFGISPDFTGSRT